MCIFCDACLHTPATVPQVPAFEITPATFARSIHRVKQTIFIPLPKELWRPAGDTPCSCAICKQTGTHGYWDTIALSATPENHERTWTVHYPELHSQGDRAEMAAREKARKAAR